MPILLILGLAVAVTAWYARRTYYVDFDAPGQVTVYQGRPGGLLLWDPTVDPRQRRSRETDLPEDARLDVEDQKEFADKGAAIAFVGPGRGPRDRGDQHDHHDDDHHDATTSTDSRRPRRP